MKKFIIFITILTVLIISFATSCFAHNVCLFTPESIGTTTQESGGVTCTRNGDGSITLNGTCTSSVAFALFYPYSTISCSAGSYLISNTGVSGVRFNIVNGSGTSFSYVSSEKDVKLFTLDYDFDFRGNILVDAGTYDNVLLKPYVVKLDFQDYGSPDSYEDYVEIYKASDDYAASLEASKNEGYIAGETEGFEQGKSEGYKAGKNDGYSLGSQNGELVGYIDGYKAGYENFNLSTEYRLENEKQYSNGFAAGVESVKQEQRDNTLLILAPSVVVCGVIAITVILIKSKKKKR